MEGNPASDGQALAFLDSQSQGSLQFNQGLNPQFHQQGSQFHQDVLPFRSENMKENEKHYGRVKKVTSDNNGINFDEQGGDGCYDGREEKREFLWLRVKWTEQMIQLLINAVNYVEEDASSDCLGGVRRKPSTLQKIGRWKCVSKLMADRGYHVSPLQCEHKFSELNKRYKRLNDVLGRGTSCKVVQNPKLLDIMHVPDKEKEEMKKILSSKNLFYEEMCSYHTGNRLHLLHDPDVHRSLQLALRSRDENEPNQSRQNRGDNDFDKGHVYPNESSSNGLQEQWVAYRVLQLQQQKLQIQVQKLELEKQQFKCRRINWNKYMELDKMRLENECMKLENEYLAFELKNKKRAA